MFTARLVADMDELVRRTVGRDIAAEAVAAGPWPMLVQVGEIRRDLGCSTLMAIVMHRPAPEPARRRIPFCISARPPDRPISVGGGAPHFPGGVHHGDHAVEPRDVGKAPARPAAAREGQGDG